MWFSTTNKGRAPVYLTSPSYLLRSNDIFHLSIYAYTCASLEVPERNWFYLYIFSGKILFPHLYSWLSFQICFLNSWNINAEIMTTCGFYNSKCYCSASRQISCKSQTQKPQDQIQSNNTIKLYILNSILTQVLWNGNTI